MKDKILIVNGQKLTRINARRAQSLVNKHDIYVFPTIYREIANPAIYFANSAYNMGMSFNEFVAKYLYYNKGIRYYISI